MAARMEEIPPVHALTVSDTTEIADIAALIPDKSMTTLLRSGCGGMLLDVTRHLRC